MLYFCLSFSATLSLTHYEVNYGHLWTVGVRPIVFLHIFPYFPFFFPQWKFMFVVTRREFFQECNQEKLSVFRNIRSEGDLKLLTLTWLINKEVIIKETDLLKTVQLFSDKSRTTEFMPSLVFLPWKITCAQVYLKWNLPLCIMAHCNKKSCPLCWAFLNHLRTCSLLWKATGL